jgi:hypothetical protein
MLTAPWHSVHGGPYHDDTDCNSGNNIEAENRVEGAGEDLLRCQECERLSPTPPPPPPPPPPVEVTARMKSGAMAHGPNYDAAAQWGDNYRSILWLLNDAGAYISQPVVEGYAALNDRGVRSVVTVRHCSKNETLNDSPEHLLTDETKYRAILASLFGRHPGVIWIAGNEIGLPKQWPLDAAGKTRYADWQRMATVFADEAHKAGAECGGAGTLSAQLASATGADILTTEGIAAAKDFATRSGVMPDMAKTDHALAEIAACRAAGMDFYAFHSYLNDAKAFGQMADFAAKQFGGRVICNEHGFRTGPEGEDTTTGPALLQAVMDSPVEFTVWYGSGMGPNSSTRFWTNQGLTLTPAGQSIVDAVAG